MNNNRLEEKRNGGKKKELLYYIKNQAIWVVNTTSQYLPQLKNNKHFAAFSFIILIFFAGAD